VYWSEKVDVVHGSRNNVAPAVAVRRHGSGDVDEVHQSAAEQVVERIRIVREHNLGHLGDRFRDSPRLLMAIKTFHNNLDSQE